MLLVEPGGTTREPGATTILDTDGLVERPGEPLNEGLTRHHATTRNPHPSAHHTPRPGVPSTGRSRPERLAQDHVTAKPDGASGGLDPGPPVRWPMCVDLTRHRRSALVGVQARSVAAVGRRSRTHRWLSLRAGVWRGQGLAGGFADGEVRDPLIVLAARSAVSGPASCRSIRSPSMVAMAAAASARRRAGAPRMRSRGPGDPAGDELGDEACDRARGRRRRARRLRRTARRPGRPRVGPASARPS